MSRIKNCIILILIFLLTVSFSFGAIQYNRLSSTRAELSHTMTNYKAYESMYNVSEDENRVFQLTINQLNSTKDSLLQKLNSVRKENNILDKRVKALAYLESQAHISDTVFIRERDTIFVEGTKIDTTITNQWYEMNLLLSYPNEVGIDMKVNSEKYLMVSTKKETIMPPKKCWLGRVFQRKHTILEVDVVERNPYIENNEQRFIEIINN